MRQRRTRTPQRKRSPQLVARLLPTVGLCMALLAAHALALACGRTPTPGPQATNPNSELQPSEPTFAEPSRVAPQQIEVGIYPAARWRLAAPARLGEVVLWLSQILIRHREVQDSAMSFHLDGWRSGQAPATRTRQEALVLAGRLAQIAREGGHFAELARQFSEEPPTRVRGGSLGGLSAANLYSWPEVLDALATLHPGEVSLPVETEFGFHVFTLRAPPSDITVSGAHLLVGYDEAPWGNMVARSGVQKRSRAEALELVTRLYYAAKANPSRFGELATKYSEHRDATRAGDFGTWSTREVSPPPLELETLASLAVGEISPPVDTPLGFQLIARTPNRAREQYAMLKLQLRFDSSLPAEDPASQPSMLRKAQELASLLRKDPQRFDSLTAACCNMPQRVIEGRDLPGLVRVLSELTDNQVAPAPLEDSGVEYLIPKRLPLAALPAPIPPRFELPAPAVPDVDDLLGHSGDLAESELPLIAAEASTELGLTGAAKAAFLALHAVDGQFEPRSIAQRILRLRRLERDVAALLGAQNFDRYHALVVKHLETLMLGPAP